jgi:integrase
MTAQDAPTMRHLAADYLEQHAIPKKRARSVKNDCSIINRIILPRLGSKKVAAVQSRDIQSLHVSMKKTPYQANRLLALLSKMLSLAVKWGWRSDNPVKGIERFQEERRERWLSDRELSQLLSGLMAHPNQRAANAVRFQLLTGARLGEVLKARWSDIDFERGVWTKPSHHTKQKRTEHIPLSGPTLTLLTCGTRPTPTSQIFSPAMHLVGRYRTSRSSGSPSPNRRGLLTIGYTTIDIPTRPISFRAA